MRLQQAELRTHFAALQHAERALHQRHGLRQIERDALVLRPLLLLLRLLLLPGRCGGCCCGWCCCCGCRSCCVLALLMAGRTRPVVHDRFVGDELVTVLLQNRAGEGAAAHHEDALVVLLELVDQRDEIAVAADNRESVDVVVGEGHLERIERQVDVGAVLVAARRRVALHHLHGVLGKRACSGFLPAPVRVRELGDDFAAFLERVQHRRHVEFAVQCGLHADFDIVKIDEHGDLQFLFHFEFLKPGDRGVADRLVQPRREAPRVRRRTTCPPAVRAIGYIASWVSVS